MSGSGSGSSGYEILGAVKVRDGLFIGDELAAQDLEFVVANKVTRVINCCGRQVPNHWEPIGVVYLTYQWADTDNQVIIDQRDVVANEIFRFVELANDGAESVLIHSVRGQSRSCCVLSAYMMNKYNWALRKTMEFLSSRRPDLNLKPAFLQQLSDYERRLMAQSRQPFSLDWNDSNFSRLECEELLLRNTYINSQMGPLVEFQSAEGLAGTAPQRLCWMDGSTDERVEKVRLEKPPGSDRHNVQGGVRAGGQPTWALVCILKKPRGGAAGEQQQQHQQGSRQSTTPGRMRPGPEPAMPSGGVGGAPLGVAGLPPGGVGGAGGAQPPLGAYGGGGKPPAHGLVPTAWAAEGEAAVPVSGMPGPAPPFGGSGGAGAAVAATGYPAPMPSPQDFSQQHPGHPSQMGQMAAMMRYGPATNIRDSIAGHPGRREKADSRSGSRDPPLRAPSGGEGSGSRLPSRDPSPKANPSKKDGPLGRGESPMRLSIGSGRGPPTVSSARGPAGPGSVSVSNGVFLGSSRASVTAPQALIGGSGGGPVAPPGGGVGPSARGMGAFRSGGPVRVKADLLGSEGRDSLRQSRPATAPPARPPTSVRNPSPLGASQRSNSRPPSPPHARVPSPGFTSPGIATPVERTKHRSLSSHMRRAPSPTPAFNRNPSPSKPRWRM